MKTKITESIRLIFYLLLIVVVLPSCDHRNPIISGEKPFVVDEIHRYDETHSKYISRNMESNNTRKVLNYTNER